MKLLTLTVVLITVVNTSCTNAYYIKPSGIPVDEAYTQSKKSTEITILNKKSPLYQQKIVPVLTPPKVFPCYVPSHIDRKSDFLIGEHWIFFKLSDASWFIEHETESVEFETKDVLENDKLIDLKILLTENIPNVVIPTNEVQK